MAKPTQSNIPIDDILVNSKNPRFEPVKNQSEALELMIEKKESEIEKLALDIVKNGLNPSKSLIVIENKGKFLTLEGNRRVVAIKLLNNPNITKNVEVREVFNKLHDDYSKQIPEKIPCVVFENEDDAHHWILLEHTGKNEGVGIDKWDSEQKDRFLQKSSRQIQIFDYADKYNIERKEVDATNLERLLSTPSVCTTIGIAFPNGELDIKKSESQVRSNIKKMFAEMSKSSFKVGDIYTSDQREKWIKNILGSQKNGKTKSSSVTSTETESSSESKSKEDRSLPKSTTRKHLIPKDFELIINQTRINNIFRELKDDLILDNSSKSTPNAVGVMFRLFLESSLDHYSRKKMKIEPKKDDTINQKIEKVTKHMETNKLATPTQLRTIRITSSGKTTDILHIQRFHEFVHSGTISPESDGLKTKWDNLQEFFEILWKNMK